MNATESARRAEDAPPTSLNGGLEAAFAQHQSELLGTLFYLTGNLEDARDALQETFLKCWKHQHEVASIVNLKAWIFRIALNTGRDLRQTAWRRKRQSLEEDIAMTPSTALRPGVELEQAEQLARVRSALGDLRSEEQEVFLLRQNGGLSYEEIGAAIGIPTGTVKTRMRLALTKLRAALVEPC